jgi:hypothetical protein
MTNPEPIVSVQTFSEALRQVIGAYLLHLEPTADPTVYTTRLEASGPTLTIHYEQTGDNNAALSVSMPSLPKPESQQKAERGAFRR